MAFEFKAQCATADEYLYPYLESAGNGKPSLTEIYCKSNNVNNKDLKICRICLNTSENCDSLDTFIESQNEDIIKKYIPSLHENDVIDSYICNNCSTNATWFISYIISCLESEEKLINCLKEKTKCGTNIQISLTNCLQPTTVQEKFKSKHRNSELPNKISIEYREKGVHRNKHYNCTNCDFKPRKLAHLQSYSNTHINKSKLDKLKCPLCSFMTTENDTLQEHYKKQHSCNNDRFHCDLCPYNSNARYHLFRHWRGLHMDISEVKTFSCNVCIYECREKSNLKRHMIQHVGQKEFKCSLCDFSTSYDNSLKLHIKNHEGIPEKFKCDSCSFSTKLKSNLRAHVRVIHNNNCKKYACHICNFKTTRKGNLVLHMRTHDEKFYFKCKHCDFQTKHNGVLKKHNQSMHMDRDMLKSFNCDLCPYKTIEKGNLTRHKLIHDTKTLLKCSQCKFSTKYKFSLKMHMAIHVNQPKKV